MQHFHGDYSWLHSYQPYTYRESGKSLCPVACQLSIDEFCQQEFSELWTFCKNGRIGQGRAEHRDVVSGCYSHLQGKKGNNYEFRSTTLVLNLQNKLHVLPVLSLQVYRCSKILMMEKKLNILSGNRPEIILQAMFKLTI